MAKLRRLGEDIIFKYGGSSLAVLRYHTSIHSLTVQGHGVCENRIRRIVWWVGEKLTVATFVEDDDPAYAAIPP